MASLKAAAIPPTATDVSVRGLSVGLSVTFVHTAKAAGRNKMLFVRDTCAAPSNIVLDRQGAQSPTGRGDLGVGTFSNTTYCQIALALVIIWQ